MPRITAIGESETKRDIPQVRNLIKRNRGVIIRERSYNLKNGFRHYFYGYYKRS